MKFVFFNKNKEDWAEVTLNRPLKKNSLNSELIQELQEVFLRLHENKKIKGTVLNAQGSCFCAGADLNWLRSASASELKKLYRLFETIETYPSPLIASVSGSVFGGGLGLLSICDFVYAHEHTQFCFSELKLGLMPALIAPFILKNKPLLKDFMLLSKPFSAPEALNLQLIHAYGKNETLWRKNLINHLESLNLNAFRETKIYLKNLLYQKDIQNFSIEKLIKIKTDPKTQHALSQFLDRKN